MICWRKSIWKKPNQKSKMNNFVVNIISTNIIILYKTILKYFMIPYKVLRQYKLYFAICIFMILFGIYHTLKPSITYNEDGSFRPFGVGYRHKTIVPAWLVVICFSLISYIFVLFLLSNSF